MLEDGLSKWMWIMRRGLEYELKYGVCFNFDFWKALETPY